MNISDLKKKAAELLDRVNDDIRSQVRRSGGFPGLKTAVQNVVQRVEEEGKASGLAGADKKQLAVEVVMLLLKFVLPPTWTSWLPEPLERFLIGLLVESAVSQFNKVWKKAA